MSSISEEKICRLVYQGPYQFLTTVPSMGIQTYRIPFQKVPLTTDALKPPPPDQGVAPTSRSSDKGKDDKDK
jgi:hypothetical protein